MKHIRITVLLILIVLLSNSLYSERWNPLRNNIIPVGARPVGMGGAYVAVADDANAPYYNPAGLGQLKHSEFSDSLEWNHMVRGLFKNYASIVFPFKKLNCIGLYWNSEWYKDRKPKGYSGDWASELGYNKNEIAVSYARRIKDNISLGANIKYNRFSVDLDNIDNYRGSQSFGVDFGTFFLLPKGLRFGAIIYNIIPFKNFYTTGGKSEKYTLPSLRLGISYKIKSNILLAFDIDDMFHLGFEYWIKNLIGLRTGFQAGYFSKSDFFGNLQWSLGIGIRYKFIEVNYVWPGTAWMLNKHLVSASFAWGYKAFLVDIINVKIDEIFASLYKTYARNKPVRVVVKNKTKNPISASVGIFISDLMKNPVEKRVELKPGVPTEVSLPILFSPEAIMSIRDDAARTAKVIVKYDHENRKSEDTTPSKFVLYGRNAFIWDDLEKLGSFVTPQDEKIKNFARAILQRMRVGGIREKVISNNFYKAMLIFDGLGAYGQIYIADPSNPYGAAATTGTGAIDYVQFPQETLKQKSGDCDDCTVLYASLLENVGIPTMLVDGPGHIFMMFDSGVTPGNANTVFPFEDSYIELDGRIWIPVETTMFGKTFFSAWDEGMITFKKWLAEMNKPNNKTEVSLIYVNAAWTKYPSSVIKEKDWDIKIPEKDKINKILKSDIDELLINKVGDKFKNLLNQQKNDPDNVDLLNSLGIIYAKNGIYVLSESYFIRVKEKDPENLKARNNLGNVYLISGDYDKAISEYNQILKIKPNYQKAKNNLLKAKKAKQKSN